MGFSLSAEQKSLLKIFAIDTFYVIPSYQRPYSWDEEQCLTLWNDFKLIFERDKEEGYFLGNIILAKTDKDNKIEVIDGQQRLITLTILFKSLLLFGINNNNLKNSIWERDEWGGEGQSLRLTTRVYENDENENLKKVLNYKEEQLNAIDERTENLFEKNLLFFYKKIKEWSDKDKIKEFSTFLIKKVFLLPILSLAREEDKAREQALTIFETINNRGLNLSDVDIFKAQLYNNASNQKKVDLFTDKWKMLIELAKSNDYELVEVFRIYSHVLRGQIGEYGNEIKLRDFFLKGNEKLKLEPLRKRDHEDVLDDLNKILLIVAYFNKIKNNEFYNFNKEKKLVKWFQVLDEYSNVFPKYIIYVYIFYNSVVTNNELVLSIYDDELLEFSKNIIKFVYLNQSAMTIKFEIFKIIVNIANKKTLNFPFESNITEESFTLSKRDGRKRGFALLSIYLNENQIEIYPYYFDKLIQESAHKKLNDTWNNINYSEYSNSIGNFVISDKKERTNVLSKKVDILKESKVLDLKILSEQVSNFNYKDFKEREDMLIKRLMIFFSGNNNDNN